MSEIAVVAARKVRLQQRADEGDERAKAALALAHDPEKFLSTVQFGITLVGVLAGAYGGNRLAAPLAEQIAQMPQLARYADTIALALVVTVITVLSLIVMSPSASMTPPPSSAELSRISEFAIKPCRPW